MIRLQRKIHRVCWLLLTPLLLGLILSFSQPDTEAVPRQCPHPGNPRKRHAAMTISP